MNVEWMNEWMRWRELSKPIWCRKVQGGNVLFDASWGDSVEKLDDRVYFKKKDVF